MQEIYKLLIGIAVLLLGIPIGNILAKNTKEELKDGRKWFLLLIALCFIGAILNLIFRNDALLFTFLFIAIVTSGSLGKQKKDIKKKKRRKV
ncbi:MAG: hypothetical protein NTZ83_03555 [Candidatus Pacearchaeota archaeon]|nr:hypothetical protein [Candidatus Pacearchaeota archaeon]